MTRDLVRLFVAGLLVAAFLLYFRWNRNRINRAPSGQTANCVNNMKQIGHAFFLWAGENENLFPFNLTTNKGGSLEFCLLDGAGFDVAATSHFRVVSEQLSTPKLLTCPEDTNRKSATNFMNLSAENITYSLRSGTNLSASSKDILLVCPIDGNILYCDGYYYTTNRARQKGANGKAPMQVDEKTLSAPR